MKEYEAFWDDATAEECCATCQRSDGEKCSLCGITFTGNIYRENTTKCTAFKGRDEDER